MTPCIRFSAVLLVLSGTRYFVHNVFWFELAFGFSWRVCNHLVRSCSCLYGLDLTRACFRDCPALSTTQIFNSASFSAFLALFCQFAIWCWIYKEGCFVSAFYAPCLFLCKECSTQNSTSNSTCKFKRWPEVSLTISSKKIRRENVRCTEASLGSVADGKEKRQKRKRHGTQKTVRNSGKKFSNKFDNLMLFSFLCHLSISFVPRNSS